MNHTLSAADTVDALLQQAQITLRADDRQTLIDMLPKLRGLLEQMRRLDVHDALAQPTYPWTPDVS